MQGKYSKWGMQNSLEGGDQNQIDKSCQVELPDPQLYDKSFRLVKQIFDGKNAGRNLHLLQDQKEYLFSIEDLFETLEFELVDGKKKTFKEILIYATEFLITKLTFDSKLDV